MSESLDLWDRVLRDPAALGEVIAAAEGDPDQARLALELAGGLLTRGAPLPPALAAWLGNRLARIGSADTAGAVLGLKRRHGDRSLPGHRVTARLACMAALSVARGISDDAAASECALRFGDKSTWLRLRREHRAQYDNLKALMRAGVLDPQQVAKDSESSA